MAPQRWGLSCEASNLTFVKNLKVKKYLRIAIVSETKGWKRGFRKGEDGIENIKDYSVIDRSG